MIISGPGIGSPLVIKVKPDFTPVTTLALQWAQQSSGNWSATDRSSSADIYEAQDVRLYGKEAIITSFITAIEANRTVVDANANRLILSSFNSTEKIFGADVSYSGSIYATAFTVDRREQSTWKGWAQPLTFRAIASTLSFVGTSALPSLLHLSVGMDADASREILKNPTYNDTFYYADFSSDSGTFVGQFNFSADEMANVRRFAATNRGAAFTLPAIAGVLFPFGPRRGAGPFSVKLKLIEEEAMWGVSRWVCKLTFVEDAT